MPISFETVTLPLLPCFATLHHYFPAASVCVAVASLWRIVQRSSQRTSVPDLDMSQTNAMPGEVGTTDGKHIMPGTHEDIESNDEKIVPGATLQRPTYESQGTDEERALILKQDLRIIPLCSVCMIHYSTPA